MRGAGASGGDATGAPNPGDPEAPRPASSARLGAGGPEAGDAAGADGAAAGRGVSNPVVVRLPNTPLIPDRDYARRLSLSMNGVSRLGRWRFTSMRPVNSCANWRNVSAAR